MSAILADWHDPDQQSVSAQGHTDSLSWSGGRRVSTASKSRGPSIMINRASPTVIEDQALWPRAYSSKWAIAW